MTLRAAGWRPRTCWALATGGSASWAMPSAGRPAISASPRPGGGCWDTGGSSRRPGWRPTPSLSGSDTQAMGVLAGAEQCGFPVPGRLSVVGFDDIEAAALLNLSTVRQPLGRSGAEGARRLCALLRGIQVRPLRQLLPLRIVQRSSSAGPAAAGLPAVSPPAASPAAVSAATPRPVAAGPSGWRTHLLPATADGGPADERGRFS